MIKEYVERESALIEMMHEMAGTGYQSRAMNVIHYQPAADVVEVKHGYWIEYSKEPHIITCSECDWGEGRANKDYKLCPMCGAKMDLKEGATK